MGWSVPRRKFNQYRMNICDEMPQSHVARSLLVLLLLLSCVAIPTTQGYRIFEDRQRPDNSTDRPFPPLDSQDYAFQLMPFNASDLFPYAGVYFSDPSQLSDSVPILASPLSPYKFWRESGNQWKFGTYPSTALWTCECSFDYPPPTNWKRVGASPSICAITNPSAGDVYTTMATESSMNITWISSSLGKYPHAVTISLINSDTSAVLATIATAVPDVGYYLWTGTGLFASYASTYTLAIKVSSTSLAVSATSGTFGVASTVASASRINGPEAELKRLDAEVLVASPSYLPFIVTNSVIGLPNTGYYSLYTVADLVASGIQPGTRITSMSFKYTRSVPLELKDFRVEYKWMAGATVGFDVGMSGVESFTETMSVFYGPSRVGLHENAAGSWVKFNANSDVNCTWDGNTALVVGLTYDMPQMITQISTISGEKGGTWLRSTGQTTKKRSCGFARPTSYPNNPWPYMFSTPTGTGSWTPGTFTSSTNEAYGVMELKLGLQPSPAVASCLSSAADSFLLKPFPMVFRFTGNQLTPPEYGYYVASKTLTNEGAPVFQHFATTDAQKGFIVQREQYQGQLCWLLKRDNTVLYSQTVQNISQSFLYPYPDTGYGATTLPRWSAVQSVHASASFHGYMVSFLIGQLNGNFSLVTQTPIRNSVCSFTFTPLIKIESLSADLFRDEVYTWEPRPVAFERRLQANISPQQNVFSFQLATQDIKLIRYTVRLSAMAQRDMLYTDLPLFKVLRTPYISCPSFAAASTAKLGSVYPFTLAFLLRYMDEMSYVNITLVLSTAPTVPVYVVEEAYPVFDQGQTLYQWLIPNDTSLADKTYKIRLQSLRDPTLVCVSPTSVTLSRRSVSDFSTTTGLNLQVPRRAAVATSCNSNSKECSFVAEWGVSRTQDLYTRDDLLDAGINPGDTITQVAVLASGTQPPVDMTNFWLSLGSTPANYTGFFGRSTFYDSTIKLGPTPVAASAFPYSSSGASSWYRFALSQSMTYDGQSGLVVDMMLQAKSRGGLYTAGVYEVSAYGPRRLWSDAKASSSGLSPSVFSAAELPNPASINLLQLTVVCSNCSGHGTCNSATGICDCDPGYGGLGCQFACDTEKLCYSHGTCARLVPCACDASYGFFTERCTFYAVSPYHAYGDLTSRTQTSDYEDMEPYGITMLGSATKKSWQTSLPAYDPIGVVQTTQYRRVQFLITAAELRQAGLTEGQLLTTIMLWVSRMNPSAVPDFQVSFALRPASQTTLDDLVPDSGLTVVYGPQTLPMTGRMWEIFAEVLPTPKATVHFHMPSSAYITWQGEAIVIDIRSNGSKVVSDVNPGYMWWAQLNTDTRCLSLSENFPETRHFSYVPKVTFGRFVSLPPRVDSVSPSIGPLAGGQTITVTGANFGLFASDLDSILIGGFKCLRSTFVSATEVRCVVPPGIAADTPYQVQVRVVSSGLYEGASNVMYTYKAVPQIQYMSPSFGFFEGGTTVTVSGINLGEDISDISGILVAGSPIKPGSLTYSRSGQFVTLTFVTGPCVSTSRPNQFSYGGHVVISTVAHADSVPGDGPTAFTYFRPPVLRVGLSGDDTLCRTCENCTCRTIQAALSYYPHVRATVYIEEGEYFEHHITFNNTDASLIALGKRESTIINCNGSRCMNLCDSCFKPALIQGLTFTHGWSSQPGGALYVSGSQSGLTISGCAFTHNMASEGSALYITSSSSVTITDCVFTQNGLLSVLPTDIASSQSASRTNQRMRIALLSSLVEQATGSHTHSEQDKAHALTYIARAMHLLDSIDNSTESTPSDESPVYSAAHTGAIHIASSGVSLSNTLITRNQAQYGAGLFVSGASCGAVTLSGCNITDNKASMGGGGVLLQLGAVCVLTGCTLEGNSAGSEGGAMDLRQATLTLSGCAFRDNYLTGTDSVGGGAVYALMATVSASGCSFEGNTATPSGCGGAISTAFSTSTLTLTTFDQCSASFGGAVCVRMSSGSTMRNCSFTNNTATPQTSSTQTYTGHGGALYTADANAVSLDTCQLTSNTAPVGGGIYARLSDSLSLKAVAFTQNTATQGGGAIASVSAGVQLANCSFVKNSALGGGGGSLLLSSDDLSANTLSLGGCLFLNNSAMYGGANGLASYASSLGLLSATGTPYSTTMSVESGVPLSPVIVVAVRDTLGNLIMSGSSLYVKAVSSAALLGQSVRTVTDGYATFDGLGLVGVPGSAHTLSFTVISQDATVNSVPISVSLKGCVEGQYYDGVIPRCQQCAKNTYNPLVNQSACLACPFGTIQHDSGTYCVCESDISRVPPCFDIELNTTQKAPLYVLAGLCLMVQILVVAFISHYRDHIVIFSSSYLFCMVSMVGTILVSACAFSIVPTQSEALCYLQPIIFNLGFNLTFSALFLKTYRLHRIFNNRQLGVIAVKNVDLIIGLGILLLFDVLLLSLWFIVSPYHIKNQYEAICESSHKDVFIWLIIVSKGLFIAAGAYLNYRVRGVQSLYNESKWIGLSIYNAAVLCVAWFVLLFLMGGQISERSDKAITTCIVTVSGVSTTLILFVPKIQSIIRMELDPSYMSDLKLKSSHSSTGDKDKARKSKSHRASSPRASPSTRTTATPSPLISDVDKTNNTTSDGKAALITNSNMKSSSSPRAVSHATDSRTPFAAVGVDAGSSSSPPTPHSPSSKKDDAPTISVQAADKAIDASTEQDSPADMTETEEAVLNGRRMASQFATVSAQLVKNANQLRASSATTAKLVKTIDGQVAELTRISMGVAYHNRILPQDQRTELDMTNYNTAIEVLDIVRKDKMSGAVV